MKNRHDSVEEKNGLLFLSSKTSPGSLSSQRRVKGPSVPRATLDHLVNPTGTGGAQQMQALAILRASLSGLKFQITRDCFNGVLLSVDDTV